MKIFIKQLKLIFSYTCWCVNDLGWIGYTAAACCFSNVEIHDLDFVVNSRYKVNMFLISVLTWIQTLKKEYFDYY